MRYELSRLTHQVSIFTEGVLVMEKTLLGVVRVEPRQILQEGLRRELVRQIASAMHHTLIFKVLYIYEEECRWDGDGNCLTVDAPRECLFSTLRAGDESRRDHV